MEPASVFALQVAALRKDLTAEHKRLDTEVTDTGPYGPFARKLRTDLYKTITELDGLVAGSGNGPVISQRRLSALRDRAHNLFGEALTLRIAGFIRDTKVDEGMCEVADTLLGDLARAVALEIPYLSTLAEAEFFGASARVIRLRYPAVSIWDLPVLGHEFGHCFGPMWHLEGALQPYPLKRFLDTQKLGTRTIAEEFFCDLLATFLLGPSYVYMCVVLRFDPTNSEDSDTHPSDVRRAWWVLRALRLLADAATDRSIRSEYHGLADRLTEFWSSYTDKSQGTPLSDTEDLNSAAEDLFATFQLAAPSAAYTDPSAAWGLVYRFERNTPPPVPAGDLRHLLNASWFIRQKDLTNLEKADRIDKWARQTARRAS